MGRFLISSPVVVMCCSVDSAKMIAVPVWSGVVGPPVSLGHDQDVVCKHLRFTISVHLVQKRDSLTLLGTKILQRKTFRSIGIKGSLKREVPGAVVGGELGYAGNGPSCQLVLFFPSGIFPYWFIIYSGLRYSRCVFSMFGIWTCRLTDRYSRFPFSSGEI